MNIGDDSLPGSWSPVQPVSAKPRKPNKTGGSYRFLLRAKKPSTIYAFADSCGLFKSTDAGTTWNRTSLPRFAVSVLLFDPQDSNILYAANWNDGVFRTIDAGASWQSPSFGLANKGLLLRY